MGGLERHFAQQALEVLYAAHRPPQLLPLNGGFQELLDHVQARLEFGAVERGAKHPGLQLTRAERGDAFVEDTQERGGARFPEGGLDQLEIAHRRRVEDQRILLLVEADCIEVGKRSPLRLAHIVERGPGGRHGQRMTLEAIARQRRHPEMVAQKPGAIFLGEDPVLQGRLGEGSEGNGARVRRAGGARGHQKFAGPHALQFLLQARRSLRA